MTDIEVGQKVKLIKWSSKMGWIWIGNHKNVTSLKWSNVTYSWTGNFKSLGIRILNHLVKFLNAYNSTNHSQEPTFLRYRSFNSHALSWHSSVKMTMTVSCLKNSPDSLRKNSLKLQFLGLKYPRFKIFRHVNVNFWNYSIFYYLNYFN